MTNRPALKLHAADESLLDQVNAFRTRYGNQLDIDAGHAQYVLQFAQSGVSLRPVDMKRHGQIRVDFVEGKANHRRLFGGGKGQLIAKATGLSVKKDLFICDATAGLGADAFVLASLGAKMALLEKSPIAYVLLEDALQRASQSGLEEVEAVVQRMQLEHADHAVWLSSCEEGRYDIGYFDPMFPEKAKLKSAVKKEMQAFQALIGAEPENADLIQCFLRAVKYRVVVKRPSWAEPYADSEPTYALAGKSCRFDIYVKKALS